MRWNQGVVRLVAIGSVVGMSACTYEGATVAGDLATRGECPEGERCRPLVAGRSFHAAEPPGAMLEEDPMGELPPVATGATTWVRYVEPQSGGFGVVDVPGTLFEVVGDVRVGRVDGRTTLATPTPGSYTVRVVDSEGALFDRTRIRVADIASLDWVVTFAGPTSGWRIWPGSTVQLGVDARSDDGERLVVLNEALEEPRVDLVAPESGTVEVELRVGYETLAATLPVASAIESIVGFAPNDCLFGARDVLLCLYGVESGDPIVGAPLSVEDRDGAGDPVTFELPPSTPCIYRLESPRSVVVEGPGGERFTVAIPPLTDSCAED